MIFLAKKRAFSVDTNIFACPCDSLFSSTSFITSSGKLNNLIQLATWPLLLPINFETFS